MKIQTKPTLISIWNMRIKIAEKKFKGDPIKESLDIFEEVVGQNLDPRSREFNWIDDKYQELVIHQEGLGRNVEKYRQRYGEISKKISHKIILPPRNPKDPRTRQAHYNSREEDRKPLKCHIPIPPEFAEY